MVTKINAIWRIIRSRSYSLTTADKSGVKYTNNINTDLATAMTLVAAIERCHKAVAANVEAQAAEAGELHRAEALREAIERLNP